MKQALVIIFQGFPSLQDEFSQCSSHADQPSPQGVSPGLASRGGNEPSPVPDRDSVSTLSCSRLASPSALLAGIELLYKTIHIEAGGET